MAQRVTRKDWLACALTILKSEGPRALTIQKLCSEMGKTKGGFYHHFGDAQGLKRAILDDWEARQTTAFIEAANREDSPTARAQILDELAAAADWGEERALRMWAWQDAWVREQVEAVDKTRISYLTELYREAKSPYPKEVATLEYAALVGAQNMFLEPGERGGSLAGLLRKALLALGT